MAESNSNSCKIYSTNKILKVKGISNSAMHYSFPEMFCSHSPFEVDYEAISKLYTYINVGRASSWFECKDCAWSQDLKTESGTLSQWSSAYFGMAEPYLLRRWYGTINYSHASNTLLLYWYTGSEMLGWHKRGMSWPINHVRKRTETTILIVQVSVNCYYASSQRVFVELVVRPCMRVVGMQWQVITVHLRRWSLFHSYLCGFFTWLFLWHLDQDSPMCGVCILQMFAVYLKGSNLLPSSFQIILWCVQQTMEWRTQHCNCYHHCYCGLPATISRDASIGSYVSKVFPFKQYPRNKWMDNWTWITSYRTKKNTWSQWSGVANFKSLQV